MEAARAPAAPQRVPLLAVQVGWLGPLKRVESAAKSALARLFLSNLRKIRDPKLTTNPQPTTQASRPGRRVESPVFWV